MKRITFDSIPGARGRLESNLELTIWPPSPDDLKKKLTVTNKSVQWKIKRAKRTVGIYSEKLANMDLVGAPTDSESYVSHQAKVADAEAVIKGLEGSVKEQLYSDNGDGSFSVPAGFWWLCESIEGNAHRNTDIQPFILPRAYDRPYQVEALTELYKYRRATLELATGLGKSILIASVALAAVKADKRVMIVVPTEYLVGQMYKQLKELHDNTTAIGGDYKHARLGWDIMVITVNSAMKFIDQPDVIIADEAHHAPARTWQEMLCSAPQATHVYNFTATAFRTDGMDLAIHAFGGPIVYSRDVKWGIDQGWLSKVHIFQVWVHPTDVTGNKLHFGEYTFAQRAYKRLLAADEPLSLAKEKLLVALSRGRRAMVIFKTVKAAQVFKQFCAPEADFIVAHANKKLSKFPKLPLKRFNDGVTNILCACSQLVAEGIDIPSANMLILTTQNSSDITTLQMIGRILRKSPGKVDAVVLDIVVKGYDQFERAGNKRLALYRYITPNVTVIGKDPEP